MTDAAYDTETVTRLLDDDAYRAHLRRVAEAAREFPVTPRRAVVEALNRDLGERNAGVLAITRGLLDSVDTDELARETARRAADSDADPDLPDESAAEAVRAAVAAATSPNTRTPSGASVA